MRTTSRSLRRFFLADQHSCAFLACASKRIPHAGAHDFINVIRQTVTSVFPYTMLQVIWFVLPDRAEGFQSSTV